MTGLVDRPWDTLVAATVVATSVTYAIGVTRLWRAAGLGHGVRPWQAAVFAAGELALLVALVSPLDALADVVFSAHMAQHEVLMLVAAPLLVVGRPLTAMLWAFPKEARQAIARAVRAPVPLAIWRTLTGPITVLVLHSFVVWVWHVPALFEGALRDEGVHAVQHATMFWTAALFFWALVHGRYGRAGFGIGVLYVFATGMSQTVLGALLTVGRAVWYPLYVHRAPGGVDPLEDQQLAGLVMWVPAGVLFTMIGLALFAAFLGEVARRDAAGDAALSRLAEGHDA